VFSSARGWSIRSVTLPQPADLLRITPAVLSASLPLHREDHPPAETVSGDRLSLSHISFRNVNILTSPAK